MATFDSREFPWSSVQIAVDGEMLTRVRGVKFNIKRDKEYDYGRGDDPLEILAGNKTPEGEIILRQSEAEKMQDKLQDDEDLTDHPPFDVVVSFVPKRGQKAVTYTLQSAEYTEDNREHKQGDKSMEITLPIMFLKRVRTK